MLISVASALLTRKAWVIILPHEDNEIVTWMSTAVIGITEDGMIVESRVSDYWEGGKVGSVRRGPSHSLFAQMSAVILVH